MNHDDTFSLVLIFLSVVVMPVGLYHRIRSYTGEKIDRWQQGVFILFGLRLVVLAMFAGVTLAGLHVSIAAFGAPITTTKSPYRCTSLRCLWRVWHCGK